MWWLEHSHGGPNGTCFASLFINSSRAVRCSSLAPETHLERCWEALGEWVGLWTRSCKTHTSMHGCKQEENTLRIPMFLMCMEVDASLWWDGRPVHILHLPKQTLTSTHTHSYLLLCLHFTPKPVRPQVAEKRVGEAWSQDGPGWLGNRRRFSSLCKDDNDNSSSPSATMNGLKYPRRGAGVAGGRRFSS